MNKLKQFFYDNKEALIKPTVVMVCICIVVTLVLAVADMVTVSRIEALAEKQQNEAMQKVLKADEYILSDTDIKFYTAVSNGQSIGYIFSNIAKGYGGDISVMTAISPEGKVIAVDILDAANETPGLGQNVTKSSFYSQFADKQNGITVVKNDADGNEIKAVTGATISSKGVTKAVNEALEQFETLSKTPVALEEGGIK